MDNTLITPIDEYSRWQYLSRQNYIQQVSIECVIFGYHNKQLKVLIPKLDFKGDFWALPSGFIYQAEDVDQAAERILRERTNIKDIYLDHFQVFGQGNRSSKEFIDRLAAINYSEKALDDMAKNTETQNEYEWFTKRFISIGYYALVDIAKVVPQKSILDETVEWYNIRSLPPMIMDHRLIVVKALKALRRDFDEKLSAFNLLPDSFTMKEVQELYETIVGKSYERANFQKKILGLNVLERLEKKFTGASNKAPYLYKFRKDVKNDDEDDLI